MNTTQTRKLKVNEYGQLLCPKCGENTLSLTFDTIAYTTGVFFCLECSARGSFDTEAEN